MIPNLFPTYPADITQHVIAAMTPRIEAEIKLVVEAVEAAKTEALKQALKKFAVEDVANDPQPPIDPTPPVPPKPGKRRTAWDGKTAAERNAIMAARWVVRHANKAAPKTNGYSSTEVAPPPRCDSDPAVVAQTGDHIRNATVCLGGEDVNMAWEPLGRFEPVFFPEIESLASAADLDKYWRQSERCSHLMASALITIAAPHMPPACALWDQNFARYRAALDHRRDQTIGTEQILGLASRELMLIGVVQEYRPLQGQARRRGLVSQMPHIGCQSRMNPCHRREMPQDVRGGIDL